MFYLNSFTYHWATKTWGSRKSFYWIFFRSTMCSISNDSKWFTSELFVSLFIWDNRELKSSRRSPPILRGNFASSQRLTTTLGTSILHRKIGLPLNSNLMCRPANCLRLNVVVWKRPHERITETTFIAWWKLPNSYAYVGVNWWTGGSL